MAKNATAERADVKRPVLVPHRRKQMMAAEMLSRCHAEADCYQRQAAIEPGKPFV